MVARSVRRVLLAGLLMAARSKQLALRVGSQYGERVTFQREV